MPIKLVEQSCKCAEIRFLDQAWRWSLWFKIEKILRRCKIYKSSKGLKNSHIKSDWKRRIKKTQSGLLSMQSASVWDFRRYSNISRILAPRRPQRIGHQGTHITKLSDRRMMQSPDYFVCSESAFRDSESGSQWAPMHGHLKPFRERYTESEVIPKRHPKAFCSEVIG